MKKNYVVIIMLLFGVMIFIAPAILTQEVFIDWIDFKGKGYIGDVIGGITAPIIGLLGAVLVYVAFHEQVKANSLIQEQQQNTQINDLIFRLEASKKDFGDLCNIFNDSIRLGEKHQMDINIPIHSIAEMKYYLITFQDTLRLIRRLTNKEQKNYLKGRLATLYEMIYLHKLALIDLKMMNITQNIANEQLYSTFEDVKIELELNLLNVGSRTVRKNYVLKNIKKEAD
jgi:hypothetical protein